MTSLLGPTEARIAQAVPILNGFCSFVRLIRLCSERHAVSAWRADGTHIGAVGSHTPLSDEIAKESQLRV